MARINLGRVMLGGVAAGVVANVVDFATSTVFLEDDLARMAQRLNLNRAVLASASVAITWVVVDFIYGLLLVWTYASMRPRFGPGPGTAVKAGILLWAAVSIVLYGFSSMGVITPDTYLKSTFFALVSSIAAALTGGYLYKE
jgi:hypothetical protein